MQYFLNIYNIHQTCGWSTLHKTEKNQYLQLQVNKILNPLLRFIILGGISYFKVMFISCTREMVTNQ